MDEKEIVSQLKNSLENLISVSGLRISVESKHNEQWDFTAKFKFQGLRFDVVFEVASVNSLPVFRDKIRKLKSLSINERAVPVLAAPYMSSKKQELCRDYGVFFIDLSGNVLISHQSFHIEKIGFPNKFPEKRQRRDPFSDKASLILRELLKSSDRLWGIREIAEKTGLNPGYVSRMGKSLEELGYVARVNRKLRVRSHKELLHDWVRSYELKRNELYPFFILESNVESIIQRFHKTRIPRNIKYALSVQAGANLIAPHAVFKEVHIYVEDKQSIEFFRNDLELTETDQGSNLVLMIPYYKNSVFYDCREVEGLTVVSDIQLYIDLYNYPVRGQEQAEYLFDKRLKMNFPLEIND